MPHLLNRYKDTTYLRNRSQIIPKPHSRHSRSPLLASTPHPGSASTHNKRFPPMPYVCF